MKKNFAASFSLIFKKLVFLILFVKMVVGRPPVAMKSNPYSPPMVGGSPYSPPMVGGMGEVKTSNSPYSQVRIGQEGNPVLVNVEVIIMFVFLYQES